MEKMATEKGKTLITGGAILSCDDTFSKHEALVMEDGKVAAIGDHADMKSFAGAKAKIMHIDGATVMPGLVNSHSHAIHMGTIDMALVDLSDAKDHDDIVARVKERAAITPPGQWIMLSPVGEAYYYIRRNYRDLVEGELPDRYVLDKATEKHPVALIPPGPRVPDMAAFNSMALQTLGITHLCPERVCDVWIHKDEYGVPTGLCHGSITQVYNYDPFWLQVLSKLPAPPDAVWEAGLRFELPRQSAAGVTSAYEGHCMTFAQIEAYRNVNAAGDLTMRCYATYDLCNPLDPHYRPTREQLIDDMKRTQSMTDLENDMVKVNGVTIGRSGPCWPGLMRRVEPYKDPYGRPTQGRLLHPKWMEEEAVRFCIENDLRLNLVMAMPLDYEDFYDSIEPCLEQYNSKTRDWIVQHAILIRESDIKRLGDLGLAFTTSKGFAWGKGDVYAERMGKHVWKDLVPLKRYHDLGVPVSGCCDWGPFNVFEQMKLAVTCELAGSGHCLTEHAITQEQSLLMWTREAARVLQWEGVGSLEVGKHADLIITDQNPVACDVDDMDKTNVMRTIVGGNTVYDSGDVK